MFEDRIEPLGMEYPSLIHHREDLTLGAVWSRQELRAEEAGHQLFERLTALLSSLPKPRLFLSG